MNPSEACDNFIRCIVFAAEAEAVEPCRVFGAGPQSRFHNFFNGPSAQAATVAARDALRKRGLIPGGK